jgi:hypothetical protein
MATTTTTDHRADAWSADADRATRAHTPSVAPPVTVRVHTVRQPNVWRRALNAWRTGQ